MEFRPITNAILNRHKTAALLVLLEIALACAIICNAVFLIGERVQRISAPSGVAETELVRVQLTGIGRDANPVALTTEDLAALRAIPGVSAAAATNQVPFVNSSWNSSINLARDQALPTLGSTLYMGTEDLVETLGLRLVGGRDFSADEYLEFDVVQAEDGPKPHAAIITRSLAQRLYPGKSGVGEVFYFGDDSAVTVVGVVEHLVRPSNAGGDAEHEYSMILPIRVPYTIGGNYIIRTTPAQRAQVLKAAEDALQRNNPNRIILEQQTFEEMRADFYRQDRSMAWMLVIVCIALLVVTALGIVGLASFWVQQRTRQIGVRRALGATRGQILRYFQTENFLLTTLGIMVGMAFAYGINYWLMQNYELPRLPALYLPAGAITLWLLGQLAVLGPALRAAAVPPAVATRSV